MATKFRSAVVVGAALMGAVLASIPGVSQAVPSYARQTNIPCLSCHTVFPALTPFGRQFKLNGYVASAGEIIESKEYGAQKGSEEEA